MTNQSTLAQAFSTTHGSPIYTYGLGPLATQTTIRRYKAKKKLLLKGLGHILNHNLSTHKNILAIFRSLFPN